MDLVHFLQANPIAFVSTAALFALLVGSFLNVVIYRLPIMLEREWQTHCEELFPQPTKPSDPTTKQQPFNLVTPRSRCPHCGHLIGALENIPILSYLLLRGRCRHCGARISARYPVVEAASAVGAVIVALHFGFTPAALAALLLTWALLVLAVIDLDTQLLPDAVTQPFLWLGIGLSLFGVFTDSQSSIIGALAGYLSLWSVYIVFKLVSGKEGMGHGDFKLLALLGAWLGWQALPLIIILSAVVGAVVGVTMVALNRHQSGHPIPFGPYLAGAGWIALLWGKDITDAYLRFAGLV